jgi:Flp pilus assembly protein CpaB
MQAVHRLVSTRWGTLLVAIGAALAAAIVLAAYLNRYRQEVKAQGTPVTVLVAKQNIPKGTSGAVIASNGLYTVRTIREGQLNEGALSDPASLRGTVVADEIYEGSQLTLSSFTAAGDSLASTLTDDQRVVTVPIDSARGLVGNVEEGNRVDVYAGFNVIPLDPSGRPVNGGQARPVVRMIVSDVPVARVGEEKKAGNSTSDVSLRVDDLDAAKIAFAVDNGKLWLALRPSAGAAPSRPAIVTLETLLLGIPPAHAVRSLGGRP